MSQTRQPISLTARRRGLAAERLFVWACRIAVFAPLLVLAILLIQVSIDGLGRIDWAFLSSAPSRNAGKGADVYSGVIRRSTPGQRVRNILSTAGSQ